MMTIQRAHERGHSSMDWLESFHTFSFADYYDPNHMHFGSLRVINEDTVQPSKGFGKHPHHDMEILTYVIDGELEHHDSMGNGSVIHAGDIQRMSAGSGVEHSEFNPASDKPVHFLQIWVMPETNGISPSYEQKTIKRSVNKLILIGSHDASKTGVMIHQDIHLYAAYLSPDHTLVWTFSPTRIGWLQVIKGEVDINGELINTGDGVAFQNEEEVHIHSFAQAELLLFDLGANIH